jgi:uncharacterized membrane protein YedE/YeeE
LVASLGFVLGGAFGWIAQRTHFCAMGGIADYVIMGDGRRLRAWFLASAVAILATQALVASGVLDLGSAFYLAPRLGWLGAVLGGLLFGFGMTLAGGCGNKTLVRIGGGSVKALVTALVLGITAYMTLRGLLGVVRVAAIEPTAIDLEAFGFANQGAPAVLAGVGVAPGPARGLAVVALAGALLWWCLADQRFRHSRRDLGAGLALGLLIPAGWLATGVVGRDEFEPTPLASFTFVAPIGEAIQYLMVFSGASINFGIAAVGGVIAGSAIGHVAARSFRIETFADTGDALRHLAGAAMMGVGGVLALGCTIGQGLSGLSTLALGSFLAWGAIILGGVLGVRYLEQGSLGGALKALFARV